MGRNPLAAQYPAGGTASLPTDAAAGGPNAKSNDPSRIMCQRLFNFSNFAGLRF
jgi:hypothetical protein